MWNIMSKCTIAKEELIKEMKKKEKEENIDLCILRERVEAIPCDIAGKTLGKPKTKRQPSAYNLHIKKCVGEEKKESGSLFFFLS